MDQGNLSRRGFLERSLLALTAGAGLPAWYARDVLAAEEEGRPRKAAAKDRVVVGAIGIGSPASRNLQLLNDVLGLKRDIRYAAVCDVDGRHVKRAADILGKKDMKVDQVKDFRQVNDRKDIDAVLIATPDHWHALIAIDAMRKGKDVYCEKPLTLTVAEGRAVADVARKTGRVFQTGSQQRSDARFRLACQLARAGRLGKITRVEARIGANPTSPELPSVAPPKELDWDFWLGPTPKVDYMVLTRGGRTYTRCHYEFRWWYDYSGGKMTDWGAHHLDIAQWGLGMDSSGPVAVEAEGAAPATENNRYNCHPTFKVTYTYANGAKVVCSDTQLRGAIDPKETRVVERGRKERRVTHDNGVLFVGEGGKWVFVCRGMIKASDRKLLDEPLPRGAVRLYESTNHMGNFFDCMRSRRACVCPAEVGHRSVTVCHLGTIALRMGKKLKWDPARERFDDAAANAMLSRPVRAPWKLEA
jgi:predicted dehydrogenase